VLIDVSIPCDENVLKKEAVTEIKRPTNRGTAHVERERKLTPVLSDATGS
jgi:hypothetical protein